MHFIDYLPLPIYILILVFSVIVMLKYIITDKKLNRLEKIGFILGAIGGISLIIMKLVEETLFHLEYYNLLWFFSAAIIPGVIIAIVGNYKKVNDPEKKRKILIGLIFMCVPLSLFGLFFLYTLFVR